MVQQTRVDYALSSFSLAACCSPVVVFSTTDNNDNVSPNIYAHGIETIALDTE